MLVCQAKTKTMDTIQFTNESFVSYELKRTVYKPKDHLKGRLTASAYCRDLIGNKINFQETIVVVYLNHQNEVIGNTIIGVGGITYASLDLRILCKYMLNTMCTGLIWCHNHPSGVLTASQADKTLKKKIEEICKLLEVNLLDSLIISETKSISF